MTVFLTAQGEPFCLDHMTSNVKARIDAAKLGKTGACHLFRHTMATLMHENGADIRFIQEILGHVKLETTQIYTHVSIRTLQQVHASTHPAAMLGHNPAVALPVPDPAAEELFAALAAETEDDDQTA
jgi:integrase/recombinase XerD